METQITGILTEIVERDGKPFGFVLMTRHTHEVPSEPAFPGDDHYVWEMEDIPLYFTTFEDSFKRIIKHVPLGDELRVTFVLRSKEYESGWATFMNPRIIEYKNAKEPHYSRAEIRGKI